MGRCFLVFFLVGIAHADIFDFVTGGGDESKMKEIADKIASLKVVESSQFEEAFNSLVKKLDEALEQRKLFCLGEATGKNGKLVKVENKAECLKEMKKDYLYSQDQILEVKKKYLSTIHQTQLKRLEESHLLLRQNIEKNFQ